MNDKGKGSNIVVSVLMIIFCVVLIGSIIRIVFNSSAFSFSSFLQYITNVPQLSISYVEIFNIGGDWGIVDGLRRFLNNIMSIANFGVWFTKQLLNGLSYIFYFVKFLVVGA